jgi:hypothetical protein
MEVGVNKKNKKKWVVVVMRTGGNERWAEGEYECQRALCSVGPSMGGKIYNESNSSEAPSTTEVARNFQIFLDGTNELFAGDRLRRGW